MTLPRPAAAPLPGRRVTRSATSFERDRPRRRRACPAALAASFERRRASTASPARRATMSVTVPRGVAPGHLRSSRSSARSTASPLAQPRTVIVERRSADRLPADDRRGDRAASSARRPSPAAVVWPAAIGPSSPIGGYEIQTSVDGGAWSADDSLAARRRGSSRRPRPSATPTATGSGPATSVGNWSAWAVGNRVHGRRSSRTRSTVGRLQGRVDQHPYAVASGGNDHTTRRAAGASAKLTFTGRAVGFVAPVGPDPRLREDLHATGVYAGDDQLQGAEGPRAGS